MSTQFGRISALAGGALALMFCVGSAQAELLTNANLDATSVSSQVLATPTSWVVTSSRSVSGVFNDGCSSEGFCNVADPGGTGVFFKAFQGDTTGTNGKITTAMYQDHAATAGTSYTLTAYAGAGAGYIGLTDPTVKSELHLDFLNGFGVQIGASATLDLVAAGLGVANAQPFNYKNYSLTATAPAGTAFVRSRVIQGNAYGNPAGGDQAFVVDAFSLNVPEPTSLALMSLGGLTLVRRRRSN